jgi:hypothetical protein
VPASNLPAGGGGRLLAPGLLAVAAALIGPALAVPAIRRAGRERVVAGAVAAGWADPGRRSGRVALGGLVATLVAFAMSPATTASAQPDPNLTVETVALFDANALETPENIAIDNHNNKYISLALTGEIRKIAPDGSQSTVANLPLGAPPLTVCGPFFAGLTGITLDQHDNLYANLASCDPDSRGCGSGLEIASRGSVGGATVGRQLGSDPLRLVQGGRRVPATVDRARLPPARGTDSQPSAARLTCRLRYGRTPAPTVAVRLPGVGEIPGAVRVGAAGRL